MSINRNFCKRLREEIAATGLPLKSIAHKSGYSVQHISAVIHERKPNPTLSFVDCMAKALGVSHLSLLNLESAA